MNVALNDTVALHPATWPGRGSHARSAADAAHRGASAHPADDAAPPLKGLPIRQSERLGMTENPFSSAKDAVAADAARNAYAAPPRSSEIAPAEVAAVVDEVAAIQDARTSSVAMRETAGKIADSVFDMLAGPNAQTIPVADLAKQSPIAASFDADGNGSVSRAELSEFVQKQMKQVTASDPMTLDQFAEEWMTQFREHGAPFTLATAQDPPVNAALDQAAAGDLTSRTEQLSQIAERLANALGKVGFTSHPPINIQSIFDNLGLNGSESSFVMKLLSERFPDGFGLELLA